MESTNYFEVLRRRWPIVLLALIIAVGTVFLSTPAEPPPVEKVYAAEHVLKFNGLNQFGFNQQSYTVSPAEVPTFVTRGEVPERVATAIGEEGKADQLRAQIQATFNQEDSTITISSRQATPERAVILVNAFADETVAYLTGLQEDAIQTRTTTAQTRLDRLAEDVAKYDDELRSTPDDVLLRARRDAAVRGYGYAFEAVQELSLSTTTTLSLKTLDRADSASEQVTGGFSAPRTRMGRVKLAAPIGLIGGLLLAFVIERFDSRLRDRRKAEKSFGAPVIAEIPTLSRAQRGTKLLVDAGQHGRISELYRTLRSSVVFLASDGDNRATGPVGVILITSAAPAEGKSTTSANLAAAFAESGRSVVVVNADFRRPKISDYFTDRKPFIPVALGDLGTVDPMELLVSTRVPGIRILDLSSVSATAGELARATRKLIVELRDHVDVVLVDSPPILVTAEALEFVPEADVVLLSARLGRTTTDGAIRAADLCRFGGVERIAVVLQEADGVKASRGKYYGYYEGSDAMGRPALPGSTRVRAPKSSEMPPPQGPQLAPNRQGLHSRRASDLDPGLAAAAAARTKVPTDARRRRASDLRGDAIGDQHDTASQQPSPDETEPETRVVAEP